jgi:phosphatidate phosphatase APP1
MKVFRLKDRTALALLAKQQRYKSEIIQKILTDFPQRKFILVGDSGEQDPEIYGELARRHPGRIARIFIRETSGRPSDNRYRTAFEDLSEDQWQVFQDAAELPIVLPGP